MSMDANPFHAPQNSPETSSVYDAKSPRIFWFRQDLRLKDNPALNEAAKAGPVIPIYILDTTESPETQRGEASRWWLHQSLESLQQDGVPLHFFQGNPLEILHTLKEQTGAQGIYWNRCYDLHSRERDRKIKEALPGCRSYNGSLLYEPWTIKNLQGNYYKVFTPFWKACVTSGQPRLPESAVSTVFAKVTLKSLTLEDLNLISTKPLWSKKLHSHWQPSEEGAQKALQFFLTHHLHHYKEGRNIPSLGATSRLSPHLHFGNISPNQIWQAIQQQPTHPTPDSLHFLSELGWREFSTYLLYHFPQLPQVPFQEKFKHMPWEANPLKAHQLLQAWQKGQTGYPLIDAGMRELWETGYMHNRVRMIVASFLTKHCLIPWQQGAAWFWDTLVDADIANNAASWQWVAGCGADAAPYFRIFNPVGQSEKFDPEGLYIRQWVPEVRGFSNKDIHAPWTTSIGVQKMAGCIIGKNYPAPIQDLEAGRKRALDILKGLTHSEADSQL